MDIVVGIGLAKTSLELIRGVREALKKKALSNQEVTDYLSDLQDKIVDIKTALVDADDENKELKRQLVDAKRMAAFGAEFTTGEGLYWRERFPYCPACWDVDRKPVRLAGPVGNPDSRNGKIWQCPVHKVHYMTEE